MEVGIFYLSQENLDLNKAESTTSANPRLLWALRKTVWMKWTWLFCHSVSNRDHGKRSRNSLFRGTLSPRFFFFPQTRDCTTFTLHDLTDFYVERVTAHHIKRNYHSCFQNSWPNSKTKLKLKHLGEQGGPLVFRGAYAACVFCV